MYRVLSPNGGLINVVERKDTKYTGIYDVLDGSGRTITINNMAKALKDARESGLK